MIIIIHAELHLKFQSFFKGSEVSTSEFSKNPFWFVWFALVSQTTVTLELVSFRFVNYSNPGAGFVSFPFVSQTTGTPQLVSFRFANYSKPEKSPFVLKRELVKALHKL